jgi:hypothetical protein
MYSTSSRRVCGPHPWLRLTATTEPHAAPVPTKTTHLGSVRAFKFTLDPAEDQARALARQRGRGRRFTSTPRQVCSIEQGADVVGCCVDLDSEAGHA